MAQRSDRAGDMLGASHIAFAMTYPKRLAPATYLVAFALTAIPLFDATMSAMPPHLHDPRWRFGAVGIVANAILFPALGALVAIAAASLFEHARTRRVLGILAFIAAVLCLAALGAFTLDALQTHGGVRPDLQRSFALASATVGVKLIISVATFCALGAAAVRGEKKAGQKSGVRRPPTIIATTGGETIGAR